MTFFATRLAVIAVAATTALTSAFAQREEPAPWQEAPSNPPASWSAERAVEFRLDAQTSLRYAIDPQTLTVGEDGVVRYVFIARSSSGAINALYEGIRCQTAEVKVYARWDPDAREWRSNPTEPWRALEFRGVTRRAMQMARGGLCDGTMANRSTAAMLDALRNGRANQFR
jgi:hypothetical protein